MAEKRMFNKQLIDSDLFLEMPSTTQLLYFHLGMRADDEGFVDAPKKIIRAVGCSEDDLKLLIAKGFVICFNSGIIVITHWKMHNTVQKDRFKPTFYEAEKALLNIKSNKVYELKEPAVNELDTTCIQPVSNMETQIRLDKIRLDLDKNKRESTSVDTRNAFDYQSVVNSFNSICSSLPKVQKLNDKRKKAIKNAASLLGEMSFEEYFKLVEGSDFLSGRTGKWTGCCFDWVLNGANLTKVIEGNYTNKQPQANQTIERDYSGDFWED